MLVQVFKSDTMKKFYLLIIIVFALWSCDKIEPPYTEEGSVAETGKKVLIEDFTGHLCNNCPRAHRELEHLKSIYGDQLISIGIHVGNFAQPLTENYFGEDFRTETGNELNDFFGADDAGLPNGMVNMRKVNGNYLLSYTEWGSVVATILAEPQKLDLTTTAEFDTATRKLDVTVTAKVLKYFKADEGLKICVYLTEDSIVGWQKDAENEGGEDIPDYVHRHVLRGSLNGTWGETINIDPTVYGSETDYKITGFSVDTSYNYKQCYVIPFVYDAKTLEIIQADEAKIFN